MKTATFHFGALAEPLAEQLRRQGVSSTVVDTALQSDVDAITRLNVRGILSDTAADKARQKIVTMISRSLRGVA